MFQQIGRSLTDIFILGVFIYLALLLHEKVISKNEKVIETVAKFQTSKMAYALVWGGIALYSYQIIIKVL